ncbi:Tfp pilus assembly protein FimT/FimU [Aquabacterium sp. J223]|uniref:pilus assembly FimT family protein n=1 Tax=Aquabacterium sp. J223 TaxID=2898431 RepID=UPI0021AE1E36|nr:prepilin-type N-terminal cleavage/methylation domain-containing protein [Aquabacterium sp. J223]UUX94599.1 prepilin-type N-terminal cleavage/methylation domain-containing protein [Aquabacterium sp. J223]
MTTTIAARTARRSSRLSRGVTMVEMGIVLAIVAVLSCVAVASTRGMKDRQLQQGVAAELAGDIQWLRMEVNSRAQPLRLTLDRNGRGSCYMIHSGPADACRCEADGPALCSGEAHLLKAVYLPAQLGVSVAKIGTGRSTEVRPGRLTFSPTLTVEVARQGGPAIRHVVAITGRLRSCAEGGAVQGLPAC